MSQPNQSSGKKRFQLADEISSSVTHALGGYLGSAALVLLVVFAVQSGTQVPWKIVSGVIFASTVIVLYSASTVYHAVTNVRVKTICRACDQMAIYALIAGTYTPICLVTLRPEYPMLSWAVFLFVWSLTLAGIVFKLLVRRKKKHVTTLTYLAMGWFGLVLIQPLWSIFSTMGLVWIVLGGVMYSIGVGFYLLRIMPFHHTVWHLFVLAGTVCHFFAILFYVIMA